MKVSDSGMARNQEKNKRACQNIDGDHVVKALLSIGCNTSHCENADRDVQFMRVPMA